MVVEQRGPVPDDGDEKGDRDDRPAADPKPEHGAVARVAAGHHSGGQLLTGAARTIGKQSAQASVRGGHGVRNAAPAS